MDECKINRLCVSPVADGAINVQWGYSGSIASNPENSKDLTFRPPGANYGNVRNVQGKYVVNGETRTTDDIAVSLG